MEAIAQLPKSTQSGHCLSSIARPIDQLTAIALDEIDHLANLSHAPGDGPSRRANDAKLSPFDSTIALGAGQ